MPGGECFAGQSDQPRHLTHKIGSSVRENSLEWFAANVGHQHCARCIIKAQRTWGIYGAGCRSTKFHLVILRSGCKPDRIWRQVTLDQMRVGDLKEDLRLDRRDEGDLGSGRVSTGVNLTNLITRTVPEHGEHHATGSSLE